MGSLHGAQCACGFTTHTKSHTPTCGSVWSHAHPVHRQGWRESLVLGEALTITFSLCGDKKKHYQTVRFLYLKSKLLRWWLYEQVNVILQTQLTDWCYEGTPETSFLLRPGLTSSWKNWVEPDKPNSTFEASYLPSPARRMEAERLNFLKEFGGHMFSFLWK